MDCEIWRYLNLEKFQSLLETSALHFAAADRLSDPYEGSISRMEFDDRQARYSDALKAGAEDSNEHFLRMRTMINCWHCGEHESKAMWDLYTGQGRGICIQSTRQKLFKECSSGKAKIFYHSKMKEDILCATAVDEIFVANVWYYDPNDGSLQDTRQGYDFWRKYTRKPNWFAYERELRAFFFYLGEDMCPVESEPITSDHLLEVLRQDASQRILSGNRKYAEHHQRPQRARKFHGILLPVDLTALVDRIILAPNSPHRQKEYVEQRVRFFGLSIPVEHSVIDVPPRF